MRASVRTWSSASCGSAGGARIVQLESALVVVERWQKNESVQKSALILKSRITDILDGLKFQQTAINIERFIQLGDITACFNEECVGQLKRIPADKVDGPLLETFKTFAKNTLEFCSNEVNETDESLMVVLSLMVSACNFFAVAGWTEVPLRSEKTKQV